MGSFTVVAMNADIDAEEAANDRAAHLLSGEIIVEEETGEVHFGREIVAEETRRYQSMVGATMEVSTVFAINPGLDAEEAENDRAADLLPYEIVVDEETGEVRLGGGIVAEETRRRQFSVTTMDVSTLVAIDMGLDGEEAENERAARTQSGRAEHETKLMPVGSPTHIGHAAVAHGATAESLGGRPAVAVDGVPLMDVGNWDPSTGDTTEVTDTEEAPSGDSAESAVTADLLPDEIVVDEETREVDFGWRIVVGELSLEDFNKISSFPELVGTDGW